TEYQSWDILGSLGIDLELEYQRVPCITVASSIARSKALSNGQLALGKAIAKCYDDDRKSEQAVARLRRLLACDDIVEVCRVLRPVMTLIDSKLGQPVDYIRLLRQLRRFPFYPQPVKAQWAQEF